MTADGDFTRDHSTVPTLQSGYVMAVEESSSLCTLDSHFAALSTLNPQSWEALCLWLSLPFSYLLFSTLSSLSYSSLSFFLGKFLLLDKFLIFPQTELLL